MKNYFPLVSGLLACCTEITVCLSLMELPPFGKGGSDIIWGLPFFGLIVLGLAVPGLLVATSAKSDPRGRAGLATIGKVLNGLSLAIPILLLLFGIIRAAL